MKRRTQPQQPLIPEPALTAPAPPKPRVVAHGGIEPGSLRGRALQYSTAPVREDDPDKIIADVKAMDSKQYRRYLKTPGNREKVNAAFTAKGKSNVNR
jgi:hypothetical protein